MENWEHTIRELFRMKRPYDRFTNKALYEVEGGLENVIAVIRGIVEERFPDDTHIDNLEEFDNE